MSEEGKPIHIDLELLEGYQFKARFDVEGMPDLVVDETAPLGENRGPNPARLLAASAAVCLSASLLFCLRKARTEVKGMSTKVETTLTRNNQGRLRIGGIRVKISPQVDASMQERVERCKELFEDFCVVTQSIRQGIPVEVEVE
ncbi:MAG: OsmC family protein [bacterium]